MFLKNVIKYSIFYVRKQDEIYIQFKKYIFNFVFIYIHKGTLALEEYIKINKNDYRSVIGTRQKGMRVGITLLMVYFLFSF